MTVSWVLYLCVMCLCHDLGENFLETRLKRNPVKFDLVVSSVRWVILVDLVEFLKLLAFDNNQTMLSRRDEICDNEKYRMSPNWNLFDILLVNTCFSRNSNSLTLLQ